MTEGNVPTWDDAQDAPASQQMLHQGHCPCVPCAQSRQLAGTQ